MPDIKTRHSTTNIKAGGKSRVKQVKKRKTGPSQAADKFYYDESFGQFFRRGWLGLCQQAKLYILSTLNIDLILWHTQLIYVCRKC